MAVGPTTPLDVEDAFVKKERTFYPAKIPVNHNQLRHIISSPQTNYVYYATLKDVYRVDLSSNKRTHIQELPFEARCTATAHGFFCAGDERGYFAFIRLPDSTSSRSPSSPVDGPLPEFSANRARSATLPTLDDAALASLHQRRNRPVVRVEQPGSDIMNSISIHKLSRPAPGIDEDIVAVITNNDKLLRIFSLTREILLQVDQFHYPSNHASISPDGQRLVVVGDREQIHFYRKVANPREACSDPTRNMCYTYRHHVTLPLYKPAAFGGSAYFTTAWSPSGRLCATASEDGYITLLNIDLLDYAKDGPDPVVAIAPSSRPNTTSGAVRTMAFAPAPWDLLIWVENFGRICVGDLRHSLLSRQVVKLDPSAIGVTKIDLKEADETDESILSLANTHNTRSHQEGFGNTPNTRSSHEGSGDSAHASAVNEAVNILTRQQERRRRAETHLEPEHGSMSNGLSDHERQVLENLRITRRREEAFNNSEEALAILRRHGSQSRPSPRSITYTPASQRGANSTEYTSELPRSLLLGDRSRVTQSPRRTDESQNSSDAWHTIEAAIDNASSRDTRDSYATIASRYLNSSREMASVPPHSSGGDNSNTITDPSLSNTNLPTTATGVTLPSLRERLPELTELNSSLRTFDDSQRRRNLMWRGLSRQLARDEEAQSQLQRTSDAATRARTTQRESNFSRYDTQMLRRAGLRMAANEAAQFSRVYGIPMSEEEEAEMGDGTTGVALGDGGRHLYVGTEAGIWKLNLDFASRKYNPDIEWA